MRWKKKEVYRGYSVERFNRIRDLMEQNGIRYQWDVDDRQTHFLGAGRTLRGSLGSAGLDMSAQREYVIKVPGAEAERAEFLIGALWRKEGWKDAGG